MPLLFSSLANTKAFAEGSNDESNGIRSNLTTSKESPAYPPTAIQLYTSKYVHFLSNGTISVAGKGSSGGGGGDGGRGIPRQFEVLSYQAVEVPESSSSSSSSGSTSVTASSSMLVRKHNRPNVGIWDCRLHSTLAKDVDLAARLLRGVTSSSCRADVGCSAYLMTLDLSRPETVQPSLAAMVQSILEQHKTAHDTTDDSQTKDDTKDDSQTKDETESSPEAEETTDQVKSGNDGTTFLSKLASVTFGAAPTATSSADDTAKHNHGDKAISILLVAVLPPKYNPTATSPITTTYKEKQAQCLLSYHLQRYAALLNCTLCFLSSDSHSLANANNLDSNNSPNPSTQPAVTLEETGMGPAGMTVEELSIVVKTILSPSSIPSLQSQEQPTQQQQQQQPSLYPPNQHDTEVIESVLLRNASCPGVWDATTDPLWVALPPNKEQDDASKPDGIHSNTPKTPASGDEEWLTTLAETVSSIAGSSSANDGTVASSKSLAMDDMSKSARDPSVVGAGSAGGAGSSVSVKTKKGKKKSAAGSGASAKKGGEENKDVTDFFSDLLKK